MPEMMRKPGIRAAGLLACLALLLPAVPATAAGDDAVVISLGDREVTLDQYNDHFNVAAHLLAARQGKTLDEQPPEVIDRLRRQYLEVRATEIVLLQEADKRGITPSREDVDARMKEFLSALGKQGHGNRQETLRRIGLRNEDQLREIIREKEKIRLVTEQLQKEIKVPPGDVITLHHDTKEEIATPEEVCLRQIQVGTEEEARGLIGKLENGADFAELARKESTDEASAAHGGDMGCFQKGRRGRARSGFEEAAFNAAEGEITGPVKSEYGFHIIKVYKHKPRHVPTLNEAYDELEDQLKHERLPGVIADLRKESGVKTYPDRLGEAGPQ